MQTISANGWTESITKAASLKGLSHLYKKWNRKTRSCRLRVFRFFELMEHLIIFYVHNYNLLRLRSQIIISCDKIEHMCYNIIVASPTRHRREVNFIGNRYIIFNLCHSEYSSQLYKQMAGQRTGKRRPA